MPFAQTERYNHLSSCYTDFMPQEVDITPESNKLSHYEIAIATPDDAPGICQVRKAVWCDTYAHDDPNPQRTITLEDLQAIDYGSEDRVDYYRQQALSRDYQQILVARDQDKVVGVIVGRKGEEFNTFVTFFVLPEYQGQGIGGKLLEPTLTWLGTAKPIKIDVVDFNTPAIEMYENRYGFRKSSEPRLHESGKLPHGKLMYEIEMTKES